jgi:hypothetical protein
MLKNQIGFAVANARQYSWAPIVENEHFDGDSRVRASDSCRPYSEQDLKHLLCLYLVTLVGKLVSSD